MFKRGDIVTSERAPKLLVIGGVVNDGVEKYKTYYFDGSDGNYGVSYIDAKYSPYTGPIYEKDGQRFVPSPEPIRLPKKGEWYFCENLKGPAQAMIDHQIINYLLHKGCQIILLPVPTLEPEHEFKKGDWVRNTSKDKAVWQVGGDTAMASMTADDYELLPGRPLTTDDLMLVLSGDKIMVECHAECHEHMSGIIILGKCKITGATYFDHDGYDMGFAFFEDGSIVFADDVEGNIFVID